MRPAHHADLPSTAASARRGGLASTDRPITAPSARPRLECPLPPRIHPHVEAAHHCSLRWAIDWELVDPESPALERLRRARFSWLAARSYPTVDAEQLELVSDWLTFLFFYDDLCDTDESTAPGKRERLIVIEDRLIELGHGAPARADDPPLCRSFLDILERAARWAGPGWLARLGRHFQEYVDGCRWERRFRALGRVPSLASYFRLRLLVSAVEPCFDFAGLFIDGSSTELAEDTLVRQLAVMANNYISWVNDIHGLDKEIGESTTSNLVLVLAHQYRLTRPAAIDRAIEMCNAELEAFGQLAWELERHPDPRRHAYIRALEAWMRGNLDWYSETLRYRGGASLQSASTSAATSLLARGCPSGS